MSNEYKDWIEDLKNVPISNEDKNRYLCKLYPFLKQIDWNGNPIEDDFSYTILDDVPLGWHELVLNMAEELKDLIMKVCPPFLEIYHPVQVKEKYGELRWYDEEQLPGMKEIINKYCNLSRYTCAICGARTTKITTGWIMPLCDECADNFKIKTVENKF